MLLLSRDGGVRPGSDGARGMLRAVALRSAWIRVRSLVWRHLHVSHASGSCSGLLVTVRDDMCTRGRLVCHDALTFVRFGYDSDIQTGGYRWIYVVLFFTGANALALWRERTKGVLRRISW